jgi:hypothetical protein
MIIQDIGKRKKLFDKKILMTGEKQRNKNNEPLNEFGKKAVSVLN